MKRILCFGDSNTWGYNPKNGSRFEKGIRWTSILQEKLPEVELIEEGLCGRTTVFDDRKREGRKGIDVLPFVLESNAPLDIIILMLGTNDCKKGYNADEHVIGQGIESLIKVIRRRTPETKILLVSPIYLGEEVWKEEYDPEFDRTSVEVSHRLKAVYKKISDKYNLEFLAASDIATFSKYDMEHMDERNHEKFATAIYNRVNIILNERRKIVS